MKILIDSKVYAKVMYLVDKCDAEISGLGKVKIEGDTVRVTNVFLLEQEVTGTTTDLTGDAVSKLLYEAYRDGLQDGELLWWWHSHVNMSVFWSGTDKATIKEFGANGRFFATVFNKKREMRSAYYQSATDVYPQVFVDEIETGIDFGLTADEIKLLDSEYTEKVKKKTWNNLSKGGEFHGNKKTSLGKKKGNAYSGYYWDDAYDDDDWDFPAHFDDPSFWYQEKQSKKTKKYNKKTVLTE